jgi:hypothetical protein
MVKYFIPEGVHPQDMKWIIELLPKSNDDEGMQRRYGFFDSVAEAEYVATKEFGIARGGNWHLVSIWPVQVVKHELKNN